MLVTKSITTWFLSVIILIVLMVWIGGVTRLTGSGLSITEWKPIMGFIPPLNDVEWFTAFDKYKQIPQFKIINSSMSVSEFKSIFFWEYFHRLIGRLIGLVVFIPGLYFILRRKLDTSFSKKVWIGFLLGSAQGFLGWFMVKSGLTELTYVSHFRLAAHLMLALFILGYWFDVYLQYKYKRPTGFYNLGLLKILLFLQLTYGAFVAGLKAGYSFNTFPKMNEEWIPDSLFSLMPTWINLLSNGATVQFIHRWLAVALVITACFQWKKYSKIFSGSGNIFLMLLMVQFLLGVITLVWQVPIVFASIHQVNGCLLVLALTGWSFKVSKI